MAGAAQQIHRRPTGRPGGALPARARLIESIEVDGRLVHKYDADFLTGKWIPRHGVTFVPLRRLGEDGRIHRDGYAVDRRDGFVPPRPVPSDLKRFLRDFKASLGDDDLLGLRFHVMRLRRRSPAEIDRILGGRTVDEAQAVASDVVSRLIAALYRKLGCVPRHWVSWIGRV